ncbi:UNVERIFIED_CONTAM: hypothetical protein HDU68_007065 [Siphonaria sp. JEL0065]|nr:hypothetical protein HDU68_007065 [Siphonaria sp. JEL0065]
MEPLIERDISPSEQSVLTFQATMYYGSSDCSDSNVRAIDYHPFTTTTCSPWTCAATDFGQSTTQCLYTFSDALGGSTTSKYFGANTQYAQVKFWSGPGCKGCTRMIHYELNQCVVSTSKADGSKSYKLEYSTKDNVASLINKRYSDSSCKNEIVNASLLMDLVTRDCTAGPLWDTYTYSVDILTTIDTGGNNNNNNGGNGGNTGNGGSSSLGAIIGGVVAGLLVITGAAFIIWYRKSASAKKEDQTNRSFSPAPPPTAEQIPLRPQSKYGSFPGSPSFDQQQQLTRDFSSASVPSSQNSAQAPRDFSNASDYSVYANPVITRSATTGTDQTNTTNSSNNNNNIPSSELKRHSMFDVYSKVAASSSSNNNPPPAPHVSADPFQDDRLQIIELKLPANPMDWTVEEASRWVSKFGGNVNYLEAMQAEEIDGRCLMVISEKQLFTVLKVTIIGRQAKLLDKLSRLKALSSLLNSATEVPPVGGQWASTLPPSYQTVTKDA